MYPLEEPTNFSMRRCYDEVRKHNYGMYFLSVLCTAHSSSLSVAGCRLSGSANWQSLCGSKFEVLRVSPTADGASTCLPKPSLPHATHTKPRTENPTQNGNGSLPKRRHDCSSREMGTHQDRFVSMCEHHSKAIVGGHPANKPA
jgi:hypothetical protein